MIGWLSAAGGLFSGKAGGFVIAFVVGMAAGGFLMDLRNDAGAKAETEAFVKEMGAVGVAHARANTVLVQSSGRREMNYIDNAYLEREECIAQVQILENIGTATAEARGKALADSRALRASLATRNVEYEQLKKSLEGADATTEKWLSDGVPDGAKCVRYKDAGCTADLFSEAGFPAADRQGAVAQPPK
jgi:hypothetical protein